MSNYNKILVKFPSRSRPEKFFATLDNYIQLAEHDDYVILCSLDLDDATMNNPEVKARLAFYPKVIPVWGKGTGSKTEAINRDMNTVKDWDILILLSDDQQIIVRGFDLLIIDLFKKYFTGRKGALHTFDGTVNERQITTSILNKELYDWFGFIYNPVYISVYTDTEFKAIVEMIGAYHMEPIVLFRHCHPAWGLAPNDSLYQRNEHKDIYRDDCMTYNERRKRNFDLVL